MPPEPSTFRPFYDPAQPDALRDGLLAGFYAHRGQPVPPKVPAPPTPPTKKEDDRG